MARLLFLLVGIAVFAWLFVQLGPATVLGMLGRVGWGAIPVAVCYGAFQSVRALALIASVGAGHRLRFRDALWVRLSGEAVQLLTFTGPFLAEPAKAWLLRRRGLTTGQGFAATLIEYLSYNLTAAAMSVAAVSWLLMNRMVEGGVRTAALVILGIMIGFLVSAALAIIFRVHLLGAILERIARLPLVRRRLRPNMTEVHKVEDLLLDVMHDRPARFARILLLESASHCLHALELLLILEALGAGVAVGTAMVIDGAAKFIAIAFFFIPGQLGAAEGAYSVIVQLVGLPAAAGFAVPFIRRIRSLVVAAAGLVGMSVLTR